MFVESALNQASGSATAAPTMPRRRAGKKQTGTTGGPRVTRPTKRTTDSHETVIDALTRAHIARQKHQEAEAKLDAISAKLPKRYRGFRPHLVWNGFEFVHNGRPVLKHIKKYTAETEHTLGPVAVRVLRKAQPKIRRYFDKLYDEDQKVLEALHRKYGYEEATDAWRAALHEQVEAMKVIYRLRPRSLLSIAAMLRFVDRLAEEERGPNSLGPWYARLFGDIFNTLSQNVEDIYTRKTGIVVNKRQIDEQKARQRRKCKPRVKRTATTPALRKAA